MEEINMVLEGGSEDKSALEMQACDQAQACGQAQAAYEPSRLVSAFYVAGFKNYDGCKILGKLKPGKRLDLVSEPCNPYDPAAVRIERKGAKLGYVPKSENGMLSLMAFYGHGSAFECRVQQVDPEAAPWQQVRVGIYVTDARKGK